MPYIDFTELKERVSIEDAAQKLGLELAKSGNQYRAPCPSCKSGGPRAVVITPAKNLFYCFAAEKGGDQIALTAHVRGCETKEAAEWLGGTSTTVQGTSTSTSTVSKNRAGGMEPLEHIDPEHQAVENVGFPPEVAKAVGIGYCSKGLMRGNVAIPVRLPDGTLIGYVGGIEFKLPTKWHGLETNVVPLKRQA